MPCPIQCLAAVFLVPPRVIVANLIQLYTYNSIAPPAPRRRKRTEPLATPPPDPNSSTADRAFLIVGVAPGHLCALSDAAAFRLISIMK